MRKGRWFDWDEFKEKWDKFFEEMFTPLAEEFPASIVAMSKPYITPFTSHFTPAIDMVEDENTVTITAEVPGMRQQDLKLTIDEGVLTIQGEKKTFTDIKTKNVHRQESRVGRFVRRVRLPDYVDVHSAKARCQDGILIITFKKLREEKPKGIEIGFED